MPLLTEVALSTMLVIVTALFHGFGLLVIGRSLRTLDRWATDSELNPLSWVSAAYTSVVVLGHRALAGIEIWFYALIYLVVRATARGTVSDRDWRGGDQALSGCKDQIQPFARWAGSPVSAAGSFLRHRCGRPRPLD